MRLIFISLILLIFITYNILQVIFSKKDKVYASKYNFISRLYFYLMSGFSVEDSFNQSKYCIEDIKNKNLDSFKNSNMIEKINFGVFNSTLRDVFDGNSINFEEKLNVINNNYESFSIQKTNALNELTVLKVISFIFILSFSFLVNFFAKTLTFNSVFTIICLVLFALYYSGILFYEFILTKRRFII